MLRTYKKLQATCMKVETGWNKFLWNKKWEGKCPDRIQRQVLKNSYEMGGLKAPDMGALNSALKVKQFMNATKSKNNINILQQFYVSFFLSER